MAEPTTILYVSVGSFYLLAAIGLLALNFSDRLNRVFSLYLVLEGGAMITYTVPRADWWQDSLRDLFTYLTLAAPFALLYLAACYRDRFGRSGLRRRALIFLVIAAALTELLYLVDHSAFTGPGDRPWRPFHYLFILLGPAMLALLLARDAWMKPDSSRRRYLMGASLAFVFYPTAFALHLFIPDIMTARPLELVAAVVGLAPVAYLLYRLAGFALDPRPSQLRHSARKYLAIFSLAPLSVGALAVVWAVRGPADASTAMRFIMTGWLVVLAALVAYAILRHQLFGIEAGLKWTLQRSFFPGILLAVLFIVEETVEAIADDLASGISWLIAGLACAVLALGYRRFQVVADRFADAAMPEIERTKDYTMFRKLQLYEAALAAAWEDGKMEAHEHRRLEELREKLSISLVDARAVEEDYIRTGRAGSPAPSTHAL